MAVSQAERAATMSAARLHAQLGTTMDRPIDVFAITEVLGIWLTSQPLDPGMYGFYLNTGEAAGICLNRLHPEQLQRYTCAHELGHHVLGHGSNLDGDVEVRQGSDAASENERAAQAFAGAFLMPLPLVNRVMRRLDLSSKPYLSAQDVYQVSREMDVSFAAAAWQLTALKKLDIDAAARYVKQGAAAAKAQLRSGDGNSTDVRAALFVIDDRHQNVPILCREGDELRFRLPENPSTGYAWTVMDPPQQRPPSDHALLWDGGDVLHMDKIRLTSDDELKVATMDEFVSLVSDEHLPAEDDLNNADQSGTRIGEPGTRELVFVTTKVGRQRQVQLALIRAWTSDTPIDTHRTEITIAPRHSLDRMSGRQAAAHAVRVAAQ